jgi:uncharacterized repeat protein (TIGR01451 family)/fimbrial isopeptide formation D2 family protein
MRSLSLNRRVATLRIGLVLLVAFMLVVTRLPFAQAQDAPAPTEDAAATQEQTEAPADGGAEDPTVVTDPEEAFPEPVVDPATDAPDVPVDTATEAPVDTPDAPVDPDVKTTVDDTATEAAAQAEALAAAAVAPDAGDFSIDWAASQPASYSHITGGGVYASGSNATTVESLNAGDFACGDIVSYLAAITVDDSAATDPATLQFLTSFATLTSSQTGIGHEDIVRVVINSGDPGMDGDAAIAGWTQGTSAGNITGLITVDDLEAGETIIVRVDVRLGCQTGGKNVGTIHADLSNVKIISPTNAVVPSGNQTIPFKQDGVAVDLIITKNVVGSAPAGASYTVTVSCLKGLTTTLTFTGSGSQNAGAVPEGDTCTVTETVNGGADRTTVSVNGGAAQNSRTATIVIGAANDVTFTNTFLEPTVQLVKSATPATVTPGGTITYTITATNTSASATAARDVVISDDLNDNLADVQASFSVAGGASQNCTMGANNSFECAVGTLAIGQSAVVTVTAKATLAACGPVKNTAHVVGSNFGSIPSNEVTVTVQCSPDLSLVKSASSTSVIPGEEFTYTLTATNPSTATAAAQGVVITDDLANSLSGVSATVKVGAAAATSCNVGAGNTISCNVGTLAIGESAVVTIKATAEMASCPSVTNRGLVSGTNFSPAIPSNDVDVTVTCTPDLTIAKSSSKATVVPGEDYSYTITAASPSSATAPSLGVVVTDDLHDGLIVQRPTFKIDGGAAQNCDAVGAGNTISCSVGDLAPGQTAVITINVTATVAACGPVVNVATATATNIPAGVGSLPVTVNVVCTPALVLVKSASAATVDAGDPITYTIVASNDNATAPAEDVVITDDLDDDLFGLTVTTTAGSCVVASDNSIECAVGDIAIDDSVTVTITAETTEAACGLVTNQSSGDGSNFTTVISNTVDVTVVCPPEMTIVKSASTGTVAPLGAFTYTISVANNADATGSPGEGVVVTDDLDDDLTGVVATYRLGAGPFLPCDPTGAGNTVRCDLGDLVMGGGADISITATAPADDPVNCRPYLNTSTLTGTNFTTIASNDVEVEVVGCTAVLPPSISLVKTGIAPVRNVGDPINYTYVIKNTGPQTLIDITLDDDILGSITLTKTTLLAGESMEATATHIISQADINKGDVTNIAKVVGTAPSGVKVTDKDTWVEPMDNEPSILLEKTPSVKSAEVGSTVTYTYVITNTGTTDLTDITLVDDKIGTIISVNNALSLAPGKSKTVTADYVLTKADLARNGEVVNVAVTRGLPPDGDPVTSTDTARVGIFEVIGSELRLVKRVVGEPGADAAFAIDISCDNGTTASFALGRAGGIRTFPIEGGVRCTATETRDGGADLTTVALGTATATRGKSLSFTPVVDGLTTVTFVNAFGDTPDIPATGISVGMQLLLGLAALALGGGLLFRFKPAVAGVTRRRR